MGFHLLLVKREVRLARHGVAIEAPLPLREEHVRPGKRREGVGRILLAACRTFLAGLNNEHLLLLL